MPKRVESSSGFSRAKAAPESPELREIPEASVPSETSDACANLTDMREATNAAVKQTELAANAILAVFDDKSHPFLTSCKKRSITYFNTVVR